SEGAVWDRASSPCKVISLRPAAPGAPPKLDQADGRKHTRTRAADDFATIARMDELRREREQSRRGKPAYGQNRRCVLTEVSTDRMGNWGLDQTEIADPAQSAARSGGGLLISA